MVFCVCGADDFTQGWQRWDDHPARQQWEVLKDLGAGALSQVGRGVCGGGGPCAAGFPLTHTWMPPHLRHPLVPLQVVLARDRRSGELAALKVVFLQCPSVADDSEHLALLQRWVVGGRGEGQGG